VSARSIALGNEILRGVVGSTAHGTAIEGQDDRDEMGVFIEPAENVCGLASCDHYIYRDKPQGVLSEAGDLDLTLYSLRKFCRLAARGNPTVIVLLWLPTYVVTTPFGAELMAMRQAFISREAGASFLGYLIAQKMKLKGQRGHMVKRPELVAKYGYDTKFATHALRLGFEGIELLTARRLTLPVAEPNLTTLRAVRTGDVPLAEALALIEDAELRLRAFGGCVRADSRCDGDRRFSGTHPRWLLAKPVRRAGRVAGVTRWTRSSPPAIRYPWRDPAASAADPPASRAAAWSPPCPRDKIVAYSRTRRAISTNNDVNEYFRARRVLPKPLRAAWGSVWLRRPQHVRSNMYGATCTEQNNGANERGRTKGAD
jgi:uncharacterized protein